MARAILGTYQGAVINELTKAVTKVDPATGDLAVSSREVYLLGSSLMGVWFGTNLAQFLFDLVSSAMFARLEVWLRRSVVERAVREASLTPSNLRVSDLQARYASDVTGVVSLYGALLRGVVVNVLLIVTNFAFLAAYEWRVATVTLGKYFLGNKHCVLYLPEKNKTKQNKRESSKQNNNQRQISPFAAK